MWERRNKASKQCFVVTNTEGGFQLEKETAMDFRVVT
jgi:hypothetical protein